MSSDSDSEAPEDVSFSTAKESALSELRIAKSERNIQQGDKEWRKKRDAQYKEQKEKKRLSLDVLHQADLELEKERELKRKFSEEEEDAQNKNEEELSSEEQESDTEKPKVSVEVLNEEEPRPLTQTVMEFKKKALYGKRIKRIDMAGLKNVKRKKYIKYKYTKPKSLKGKR